MLTLEERQSNLIARITGNTLDESGFQVLKDLFQDRSLDINVRMTAYLEYTAQFYRVYERAQMDIGYLVCTYFANGVSPGCAIGHLLDPSLAKNIDKDLNGQSSIISVLRSKYYSLLPEWLKDFDTLFLTAIQGLHDTDDYWNENNLTDEGVYSVANTLRLIDSGHYSPKSKQ